MVGSHVLQQRTASQPTHTSIAPSSQSVEQSLQAECERLRRELADQERIAERSMKGQAEMLDIVTGDYEKQLRDLNEQLAASSE